MMPLCLGGQSTLWSARGMRLNAIHGWLLVLPAAVLLGGVTHHPTVATVVHSFVATAKGDRAAPFVALENYAFMLEDPIFWRVLGNNLLFALGPIPVSIALALLMATWVNGRIA